MNYQTTISQETATQAYYATSFTPKERGARALQDHQTAIDNVIASIKNIPLATDEDIERFCKKADELFSKYLYSHANTMSAMITGPAKFPTARNQKRQEWAQNHYERYSHFMNNVVSKIAKKYKKKKTNQEILEEEKELLVKLETLQEKMKDMNKIIRKKSLSVEEKAETLKSKYGLTEEDIDIVLNRKTMSYHGFAPFQLTNNNAKIKRVKAKIRDLEAKEAAKAEEPIEVIHEFEGGYIQINREADRHQVMFEDKPDSDIRTFLKRNGYKWSPRNQAWQRKITDNAIWVLHKTIIPFFS